MYPEVEPGTKKGYRGFYHPATARLLCPREMRDRFDQNPDDFCMAVLDGALKISHHDWPTFLYPEDGYKVEVIDHTLLQGPFLLAVRC
jgi:hypothetical protein